MVILSLCIPKRPILIQLKEYILSHDVQMNESIHFCISDKPMIYPKDFLIIINKTVLNEVSITVFDFLMFRNRKIGTT